MWNARRLFASLFSHWPVWNVGYNLIECDRMLWIIYFKFTFFHNYFEILIRKKMLLLIIFQRNPLSHNKVYTRWQVNAIKKINYSNRYEVFKYSNAFKWNLLVILIRRKKICRHSFNISFCFYNIPFHYLMVVIHGYTFMSYNYIFESIKLKVWV